MNGIHEVRGSIPLASTLHRPPSVLETPPNMQQQRLRGQGPVATIPSVGLAGIAQLVEHNLAKVGVAGSSPVSRSRRQGARP